MPPKKAAAAPQAWDLRVTLQWIRPEVWRLIRVPHDIRMDRLHNVLQAAFGWTDSHLHQYHLIGTDDGFIGRVVMAEDDDPFEAVGVSARPKAQVETKRLLKNFLVNPGDRIAYEYDFGDGWMHEVRLVAVHQQTTRLGSAMCLEGARACPPEDCGGPPGYENFVAAMADPKHEEHESMKEWIGDEFDPEAFDLAAVNRLLARVKV